MSAAVTIREQVREALLEARPGGLTMAAIAGAVKGPWRERDVRDAVRRLWEISELGRRPDGTYVVVEKTRPSGASGIPARARRAAGQMDQAVKRVADGARRDGHTTKIVVRQVDPALLRPWCAGCRERTTVRLDGTCTACGTQTGSNVEAPKPARRRRTKKPLRQGQPGWGPTCPRCSGPKGIQAHTCHGCRKKQRGGYNRGKVGGRRRGPTLITEELLLEARALYATGLSLRGVAAQIHELTGYKTKASCAEALHGHFKRRGWKLRPQPAVTAARSFKHGRKPRNQTNTQQTAYRHWLAQQRGWRTVQGPGRPDCKGVKSQPPNKGAPCTKHAMDGSDYCYAHAPERAAQRDAHLERMRAAIDPEENLVILQRARDRAQESLAAKRANARRRAGAREQAERMGAVA